MVKILGTDQILLELSKLVEGQPGSLPERSGPIKVPAPAGCDWAVVRWDFARSRLGRDTSRARCSTRRARSAASRDAGRGYERALSYFHHLNDEWSTTVWQRACRAGGATVPSVAEGFARVRCYTNEYDEAADTGAYVLTHDERAPSL